MPKSSKSNLVLDILSQLVELFLKTTNKRKRTWHQHVVPYKDRWAVRREGNKRIGSKHRYQHTAIKRAKRLAKKYKADVIVHRADGTIRDRIGYE